MARGSRGGGGGGAEEALLAPAKTWYGRCRSHPGDELRGFRSCLRWMCMDQSDRWRALMSWFLFFVLSLAVPIVSHFVLSYNAHRRPYDLSVQLSLTAASALSFLCLSAVTRRYGLRRFLFLDKLRGESENVRLGYNAHLDGSFRLLSCFVLPLFAAETAYKIWWYCAGAGRIPFLGNPVASDVVACLLELASWIYRTATFFLVCVLFRLICQLEILRLQEFATVFQEESEVGLVLSEHLRIRRQLRVISHRFRGFILSCLVLVTASQFAALLLATRAHSYVNLFNTGELALCSIVLVTGLLICLRSAAKITHKAQALTSHAAKWHVCATIDSFYADPETPCEVTLNPNCVFPVNGGESESDEEVSAEDELEDTKIVPPHAHTISFQKRQALVTYLENNRAGITIFGFTLDRTWLHTVFMLETTLFLWLLGKTIGIS
ncbi:Protein MMS22-like [Cocos nucifera]|uniref:Protein MMS22-like n=1 Tax=Cocos nucifera TaxID=13894 RepID=A0A8K0HV72_COCNU|nr:Protein MMS22-like [Cocos nucifera]